MLESGRTRLPIMPHDPELVFLSITRQAQLIHARALSPVELVQAYLARIARYDPVLRAYITVCADRALADATAAEREIAAGRYRGPLHGIPFGAANVPALVLPMGYTRDRLPLSLQIAGRPYDEETVYRIGHAYERATPWHGMHPDLDATLRDCLSREKAVHA